MPRKAAVPGWALHRHSMYPTELQEEPRASKHRTEDRLKRMALSPADLLHFSACGSSVHSKGLWVRAGDDEKMGALSGLGRVGGRPT